jgi:GLPGLI family protein
MESVLNMMDGSKMEIYFSENKTRSEMKMGNMITITTISDKDSAVILMGGMMGNNAYKTSINTITKENEINDLKITLYPETKKILNYTCKKAVLSDSEGNEYVYWYTDEIKVSKKGQSYLNKDVPGMPMEFDIKNKGINMKMSVSSYDSNSNSENLFEMKIPKDYTILTKENFFKMGM